MGTDTDQGSLQVLPVLLDAGNMLEPGTQAGSYRIDHLLGRGGCGIVYLATRPSDGQVAAVKVLHRFLADDPNQVERFAREVRAVDRIKHPSVVATYEVGALPDGRPYFAMEVLDGPSVHRLVEEHGRLSPVEAYDIVRHVGSALSAAHELGIVHRDVKADNIIVCADHRVKLLDFGIAKLIAPDGAQGLTTTQQLIGTLVAMAPEQIRCGAIDARTDVYGLGTLLYCMLTGVYPFRGSAEEVARMHLEDRPRPPSALADVSPDLDAVVLRCLAKDPEARFQSVAAVVDAVRLAVFGAELPTHPQVAVGILVSTAGTGAGQGGDGEADALADAVELLDAAEAELVAAGHQIAVVTSSEVLGIALLPDAPAEERELRARAIALGERLTTDLRASFPTVNLSITVNVADVQVREGGGVTGGPLLEIGGWSWQHGSLCVTARAGADLPPLARE